MTITTLTAEQRAGIPEHVQRWIRVGLSTEPVNRKRATEAVLKCYTFAGLPEPRVKFADSFRPKSRVNGSAWGAVCDAVWGMAEDAVWDAAWDAVGDAVRDAVGYEVRAAVGSAVGDAVGYAVGSGVWDAVWSGQYDAHTCATWRFCVDVLGIEFSANIRARLDAWCEVVQSCGGVYWGRDVVTIVDRPQTFERDRSGSITAVVYRDEWRVRV